MLDTVALLADRPELHLKAGQVGTVVEALPNGQFLIEFANDNGETYGLHVLPKSTLLRLTFSVAAAE
jgi:hypothetical protein